MTLGFEPLNLNLCELNVWEQTLVIIRTINNSQVEKLGDLPLSAGIASLENKNQLAPTLRVSPFLLRKSGVHRSIIKALLLGGVKHISDSDCKYLRHKNWPGAGIDEILIPTSTVVVQNPSCTERFRRWVRKP